MTEFSELLQTIVDDKRRRLEAISAIKGAFASIANDQGSSVYRMNEIIKEGRQTLIDLGIAEREIDDAE